MKRSAADTRLDEKRSQNWLLTSPARLHFGLMEVCPGQPMLYGGLGAMIREPSTKLTVSMQPSRAAKTTDWRVENAGDWQRRIESLLQSRFSEMTSQILLQNNQANSGLILSLSVEQISQAHAGLGSGTQIACSVASLQAAIRTTKPSSKNSLSIFEIWQTLDALDAKLPTSKLAIATGRGLRSYVGLAGHLYGGLIFDRGVSISADKERIVERYTIPEFWPVLLIRPTAFTSISGKLEADYFAEAAIPNANRDSMLGLIHREIVPAIQAHDLPRFGNAIYTFGRYGGELFQKAQGGIYRDAAVTDLIESIRAWGISATGQSSWGPTVYAIVDSLDRAHDTKNRLDNKYGARVLTSITQFTNQPATITCE